MEAVSPYSNSSGCCEPITKCCTDLAEGLIECIGYCMVCNFSKCSEATVRKALVCRHFTFLTGHFTKTGSGQT